MLLRRYIVPLGLAKPGEINSIKKIGGRDDMKKRLETLGFVVGGAVTVVSEINGNVIVNVKDARIAISREMANKIIV
jgi:ferrous iron transport protein A